MAAGPRPEDSRSAANAKAVVDILSSPTQGPETVSTACNTLRTLAADPRTSRRDFDLAPKACTRVLENFRQNEHVLRCASMAIAALGEKKEMSRELGHSGCISQIFAAWEVHMNSESLVKALLLTMRSLTMIEENRVLSCSGGGVALVVRTLQIHCKKDSVVTHCLAVAGNLVYRDECAKGNYCGLQGIRHCVSSMASFGSVRDEKLHEKGCILLRSLAVGSQARSDAVVMEGGLRQLLKSVSFFQRSDSVQEQALQATLNIVKESKSVCGSSDQYRPLLEAATKSLVNTRAMPERCARVHGLWFDVLRTLLQNGEGALADAGQGKLLSASMEVLQAHLRLLCGKTLPPASLSVAKKAAPLLRSLAFSPENRASIVSFQGGIKALVSLVRYLGTEPMHTEQAFLAVGNTVFDSVAAKEQFGSLGGIGVMLAIMQDHRTSAAVQEAGFLLSKAVCDQSQRNSQMWMDAGGLQWSLAALKLYSSNAVLQETLVSAVLIALNNEAEISEKNTKALLAEVKAACERFPLSALLNAHYGQLRTALVRKNSSELNHNRRGLLRTKSRQAKG